MFNMPHKLRPRPSVIPPLILSGCYFPIAPLTTVLIYSPLKIANQEGQIAGEKQKIIYMKQYSAQMTPTT